MKLDIRTCRKAVNMVLLRAAVGLLLGTAAVAAPTRLTVRDEIVTAHTLISDIGNINAGVESLRKHVAAFDGSPLTEAPLLADFTAIHLANRKGFADANLRAAKFNAKESRDIVQFTIDSVGNSIPAAVRETVAKKPEFERTGQSPVVVGTFKLFLDDHDTFSAALQQKISADFARAQAVVSEIHHAIQSGIDAFSA